MEHINPHYQEWLDSGISESLIEANLLSFPKDLDYTNGSFYQAAELLIDKEDYATEKAWQAAAKTHYATKRLTAGAWGFRNQDIRGDRTGWAIVKPHNPRKSLKESRDKGIKEGKVKTIKYEAKPDYSTEIFIPVVPKDLWLKAIERNKPEYPNTNDEWHALCQRYKIDLSRYKALASAGADFSSQGLYLQELGFEYPTSTRSKEDKARIWAIAEFLSKLPENAEEWEAILNHFINNDRTYYLRYEDFSDYSQLNYWIWAIVTNVPVIVTEGLKKQLCLISCGHVTLGLSGVNGGYKEGKLREDFEPFLTDRQFYFCFDADEKVSTVINVNNAACKTAELIDQAQQSYYTFNRLQFFNSYRALHDLEEDADFKKFILDQVDNNIEEGHALIESLFKEEEFNKVQIKEFGTEAAIERHIAAIPKTKQIRLPNGTDKGVDDYITNQGLESFAELYANAEAPFKVARKATRELRYPTYFTNSPERYLSDACGGSLSKVPGFDKAKLIALRAAKGTGKSTTMASYLNAVNLPVIVLTHRQSLGRELASKFQIRYAKEDPKYAIANDNALALCVDSLHINSAVSFDVASFIEKHEDYVIIIDEVEQWLKHLLQSNTAIQNVRNTVLRNLHLLLSHAHKTVVADADTTNLALDFLAGFADLQSSEVLAIDHGYLPAKGRKAFIYEHEAEVYESIIQALINGEKVFITTQGAKANSPYGSRALEARLKKFSEDNGLNLRFLRIDGESLQRTDHPASKALGDLNRVAQDYDVIIASPSIGTGVSFDKLPIGSDGKEFSAVFSFFQGVLDVPEALQAVERVRADCDRHIFITDKPNCWALNNKYLTDPEAIAEYINTKVVNSLSFTGYDRNFSTFTGYTQALEAFSNQIVRENTNKYNYKGSVIGQLLAEGYTVEYRKVNCNKKESKKKQRQVAEILNDADITRVATADYLSADKFADIQNSNKAISSDDFFSAKRMTVDLIYELEHDKDGNTHEWLIAAHEDGLASRLKNERLLQAYNSEKEDNTLLKHEKRIIDLHTDHEGIIDCFKPDLAAESKVSRIKLLCDNGFWRLIEAHSNGRSNGFNKHNEDFILFWEGVNSLSTRDKQQLGRIITDKTDPIKFLSHILNSFGFQLNREGASNKRRYTISRYVPKKLLNKYSLEYEDLNSCFEQILSNWDNRANKAEAEAEAQRLQKEAYDAETLRLEEVYKEDILAEQAAVRELTLLEAEEDPERFAGKDIEDVVAYEISLLTAREVAECPDYTRRQLKLFQRVTAMHRRIREEECDRRGLAVMEEIDIPF